MSAVIAIFTAAERAAAPQPHHSVSMVAGAGISGDRHCNQQESFLARPQPERATEATLIEAEAIDAFNQTQGLALGYGDLRRNIVTRGVDLNALVGKRFHLGDIEFEGIELCEPCNSLARRITPLVLPHLVHRAGLRAAVLSSGTLQVGDRFSQETQAKKSTP
ncbi:MAG: MOSC domain-containing protein [Pseudomonadota bacterium]